MNILICVDLQNIHLKEMKNAINELTVDSQDKIHLVHVFRRNVYADNFIIATYPLEKEEPAIKESVIKSLQDIASELPQKGAQYICDCQFSVSPKEQMIKYIEDSKIDKTIVMTRKKHGFFQSSFAQYILNHSECDLNFIRIQD